MAVSTVEKKEKKQVLKPRKPESFRYKFKVKDLEKMYEAGIFKPDEKVELINGEVIKLSPIGLKHALVVDNLVEIFSELLQLQKELKEKYSLRVQNPIYISPENLPEPDIALVDKEFRKEKQHPKPKYIELLIEVADTTLEKDRYIKIPLYAKKKIKQVWIVDLNSNQIEVYTNPYKKEYLNIEIYPLDKKIKVFGKEINVKDILNV
ncbi:Putative restriction endonuclease [Persephonella hydrogeniphila]|uniref:Putative restriction endonuclease n=1 Tax=Persephonella hydrogeniphila TaxID=198703 RepID=A0A285NCD5_9AQUI|nr:Uma2 family endonuclease [Persephonella hydrogeniphila]SNZ06597.1 Putative restriction endonuclease [Persephonella hydrogeniphila]